MKTTRIFILRSSLFVLATLFSLGNLFLGSITANAQSASDAQAAAAQSSVAPTASTANSAPIIKPAARIWQKIDEAQLVPLHNRVHPLARAEFDRGVVSDSQPMNRMLLVLKRSPEQQAALGQFMDQQQTKNSPNYHAWLTPTTFGQQFGVADADIQTITNWLAQKGFTGIKVHPGGMFIEFSGTAGTVRSAFHTEIHRFNVKGEMHMANVAVPRMPAAFAPVIASIHSLHNFRKKSFLHFSKALEQAKARAAASGAQFTTANLCPNPPNGTQPCAAVGPGDFAKIYNLPSILDGTGQTIALVARSNIVVSDINQFGSGFGISNLANFTAANNVILTGPDPGLMPGDQDEATLDVEWSGAVAPKANILLVPSDSQDSTFIDGVDLSSLYIVENNLAQILSQSFGICEAESDGLDTVLWEQAAAQGITVTVSTGDTGSASCDPDQFSGNFSDASDAGLAISGDAATPFNVAVGGTDFDDATNPGTYWNTTNSGTGLASAISYIPETTWNGGCASAATSATLNSVCSSIVLNPAPPADPSPDLAGGSGGQSNCSNNTINVDGSVTCAAPPNGGTPKPIWQQTAGLTGMPADGVRDIPDVSLFAAVNTASNQFYIICEASSPLQNGQPCSLSGANLNFSGVGGTSASTPAFAGIIALVNQSEVNGGRLKAGEGQGNVNYVLYKLAAAQYANASLNCNSSTGPAAGCTFNDITKGNNSVPCVGSFATLFPNVFDSFTTPDCSTAAANAIGVLVEPSTPNPPFSNTTPGFTTTTGYDLATGLGSVNVTNLVANWPNVTMNYKSSTSTITSTVPSTPTVSHGANVTFNVSVTSASGTPTGDVSLIPGEAFVGTGAVGATLAGGTAQIVTNELPGGTYPVTVHYAGDGTFAPSDSAPLTVTVSKENSSSQLAMWEYWTTPAVLSPASAPYGSPYLFRVDVIGSNASDTQSCTSATVVIPCPTGKVTFTADGNPLNDFFNNGGAPTNSALLNPFGFIEDRVLGSTGLPAGAHSIAAAYAGDNSYNGSTASTLAITITQAPTQTAVVAAVNGSPATTVLGGQTMVLTVGVLTSNSVTGFSSAGAGPTGSVTLSSCGTAQASPCTLALAPVAGTNLNGGAIATASLTTSFTTAGSQTITATYTGDTNYAACTANGTPAGCQVFALPLTVSTTSVLAAGKLAFLTQPSNVAAGASIAPGVQVQVEDSNGNVVAGATNSITIAIGTNPSSGTLGGTVTATPVNGIATFSNLSISPAGAGYTLTASATGLTGATSTAFNVAAVPAKLAFVAQPSNSTTGSAILPAVQVAVEDASGNVLTGATNPIAIAILANPGSATLGGTTTLTPFNGIATFVNLSVSAAGTGYTLAASATGLTGATSTAFNVTASPAKLAFTVQPSNVIAGASITPPVQVAVEDANGNILSGATNPVFMTIGTNPGSGTLGGTTSVIPVAGVATFSNLTVSTGGTAYTLTANSTSLASATSGAFNVTAPPAPAIALSSTPVTLNSATGAAAGSTITVTPSNGFTGTVAISTSALSPGVTCSALNISVTGAAAVTGTLNCQVTAHSSGLTASNFLLERNDGMLDAKAIPPAATPHSNGGKGWWAVSAGTGFAALLVLFIPGGRKQLRAALGLGLVCLLTLTLGCNGGSGGGGGGAVATTTAMTVNADTEPSGTAFTFSVKVTATGATPTGMVQLFDGAALIGTPAAVSGGTATPTAPALSVGTHAISAHYLGDTATLASQSGTLDLTSQGSASFTITGTSGNTSANATVNITVN